MILHRGAATHIAGIGIVAVALVAAFALLYSGPAAASTFTVDTQADAVDAHPGDGICATASGQCSLRAAVQEANARPGADTITLPAGTFALGIGGAGEDAAATGDLDITDDLSMDGAGAGMTAIDGAGLDRVLHVPDVDAVHLSGLTVIGGNAGAGDGGGIFSHGTLTLRGVTITGNRADDGGGVVNTGALTVDASLIVNNTADDAGGGINNDGVLTVTDTTIRDNHAVTGAGINNLQGLALSESVVSGNRASSRGGGISNSSAAQLTNATISGNSASFSGGGLANFGDATLINVTLTQNSADVSAGGILLEDTTLVVLRNTIVAGNTVKNCNGKGAVVSSGHNLEDADTCGLGSAGDLISVDPMLAALGENGGPTRTRALLPGSPAIDAGDAKSCPAIDQRGFTRPADGDHDGGAVCDIGAYEFGAVLAPTPTTSSTPTVTATPTRTGTPAAPRTPTRTPARTATPAVVAGDADCDGRVTSLDATLILQAVAFLLTPHQQARLTTCPADANGDGGVGVLDATVILQFVAGLLRHLPP